MGVPETGGALEHGTNTVVVVPPPSSTSMPVESSDGLETNLERTVGDMLSVRVAFVMMAILIMMM